jgi:hypothetical protein
MISFGKDCAFDAKLKWYWWLLSVFISNTLNDVFIFPICLSKFEIKKGGNWCWNKAWTL